MGVRLGFVILPPESPEEFPKMLYKNVEEVIVDNKEQEREMLAKGFVVHNIGVPPPAALPPDTPHAPTFTLEELRRAAVNRDSASTDSEVSGGPQ